MSKFNPKFMNEWLEIKREGGYKLLFKKKGWYKHPRESVEL